MLDALAHAQRHHGVRGEYTTTFDEEGEEDISFVTQNWRKAVNKTPTGQFVRKPSKAMVLTALAEEPRTGDVAVVGSEEYADWSKQLLQWEVVKEELGLLPGRGRPVRGEPASLGEVTGAGDQGQNAGALLTGAWPGSGTGGLVAALRPGLRQGAKTGRTLRPVRHHDLRQGHQHGSVRGGPAPPGNLGGYELSCTANRHFFIVMLNEAIADLVKAHARPDISQAWGDGTAVAADGTHMDTYLENLLFETSVRYGKPGDIAYHHISDTNIAWSTHFVLCGV